MAYHKYLFLAVILLFACLSVFAGTEKDEKTSQMFRQFRHLFDSGRDSDFYEHAKAFEDYLKDDGDLKSYYKTKTNEGFYDIKQNHLFRAMQTAKELDSEARKNKSVDYYYLATGLMGNIYRAFHDTKRAEQFFVQALEEVGESDPKFTVVTMRDLSQLLCLKRPADAVDYAIKSIAIAKDIDDISNLSLSTAMLAFVHFLNGDREAFEACYLDYQQLLAKEDPKFDHQYDNIVEIARLTFDGAYDQAIGKLRMGHVFVDSSLVGIRIYAYAGDIDNGFMSMKRRCLEMDSVNSLAQESDFNQIATERTLMRSREVASANKHKVRKLTNWIIGICVVFLIIYMMGRRRLTRIIWDKNKKLKEALSRAEESNRMKTAFVSNMSHEIRTPLNAVSGFSEVLCTSGNELSESEKKDMQDRIISNVDLITTIVNEVLEFSKSESESGMRPSSEFEDVMINVFCQKLLRSVVTKEKEGVETRFSTNVADDFILHTHPRIVSRIMTHIINNAQKFTEKGYFELRCEYDRPAYVFKLIVKDTGIGIKPEDQDRIFDLFEKGTDNFKEGIGLGLPISQRLAKSIGANIALDKTYTEGCRFVLSIPVK